MLLASLRQNCWLWGKVLLRALSTWGLSTYPPRLVHSQGPSFLEILVFLHHPFLVGLVLFTVQSLELTEFPNTPSHSLSSASPQTAPRASSIAKCCVYWSVILKSIVSEPKKHTHSAPHKTTESLRQAHNGHHT